MKKILTALALVSTMFVTESFVNNTSAYAAPKMTHRQKLFSKYAKKFHKVIVLQKTQVYKVHPGPYEAANNYTKAYTLKPGDVTYIRDRGVSWSWTVGKSYRYCIFSRDSFNFDWFIDYDKEIWIPVGYFSKTPKETKKCYHFTGKQEAKLAKYGFFTHESAPKKVIRYVKSIHPKTEVMED